MPAATTAVTGAAAAVLVVAAVMVAFHDRGWSAADDGHFAYIADQLLRGALPNRDVPQHHPGYVHWINAAAMAVAGSRVVSLRYPLALFGVLQAGLMFWVMRRRGTGWALAGALAVGLVGMPQISTVTAGLYVIPCVVAAAALFDRPVASARLRFALGVVIGVAYGLRQLSGILLAVGVVSLLLYQEATTTPARKEQPARRLAVTPGMVVAGVLFAGTLAYAFSATDVVGWVLFGVWPIGWLAWLALSALRRCASCRPVVTLAPLVLGVAVALAPLVGLHAATGSLGAWWQQTFWGALRVPRLEHLAIGSYAFFIKGGIDALSRGEGWVPRANGAYWLLLCAAGPINGVLLWLRLLRRPRPSTATLALPVLATVHGLVAVFNQIAVYAYLAWGLLLGSILVQVAATRGRARYVVVAVVAVVLVIAVVFQAGRPYATPFRDMFAGIQRPVVEARLDRLGLRLTPPEAHALEDLVGWVMRNVPRDIPIAALPNLPEIFFLTERRNVIAPFNVTLHDATSLGENDVNDVWDSVMQAAPAVVITEDESVYATGAIRARIDRLLVDYRLAARFGSFAVFRRSSE